MITFKQHDYDYYSNYFLRTGQYVTKVPCIKVQVQCNEIVMQYLKLLSASDGRTLKWHINQALKEYCEKLDKK